MIASQRSLNRALDKALARARSRGKISLSTPHRYVIFSDHHKGAGTRADDFRRSRDTYMAALDYYLATDFTLIVLGDVEELWEEDAEDVFSHYGEVMEKEGQFHPSGCYVRVYGNHDIEWRKPKRVNQHLHPFYPGLETLEGLLFDFQNGDESGEIFLVHGHQGTLESDIFAWLSAPLVRLFWRTYQIFTDSGHTRPAQNPCLRGKHDTNMYHWVREKPGLILIAGHTHRPVWSSRTHLEKLMGERYQLLQIPFDERPPNYDQRLAELNDAIAERARKYPPCEDTIKPRPNYFNTGCCSYEDGDITGIEIQDGELRLVRWGSDDLARHVLEKEALSEIFFLLHMLNQGERPAIMF